MRIAFVFPGQGSQSVGMMAGFDAHPAIRSTFDEASEVLGAGSVGARHRRAGGRPQSDGQHPAGDAHGGRCRVARVERRGRGEAGMRRRPQSRRIHGAGRGRRDAVSRCGAARSLSRRGDAARSPRGRWRDGCDPGPRCRGGRGRLRGHRGRDGRGARGRACQFQRTGADRDRRPQGRRRARNRGRRAPKARSAACCFRCRRRSTAR